MVHIFTFNDGILITRQGKAASAKVKGAAKAQTQQLVADQFLHIRDIAPVNLRDSDGACGAPPGAQAHTLGGLNGAARRSVAVVPRAGARGPEIRNAVKLVASPRSFLFKAATRDDKARWLALLKTMSEAAQKADRAAATADPPASPLASTATPLSRQPAAPKLPSGGLALARQRFSRAIAAAGSSGQLKQQQPQPTAV